MLPMLHVYMVYSRFAVCTQEYLIEKTSRILLFAVSTKGINEKEIMARNYGKIN